MAERAHTTPTIAEPIVAPKTARERINDALYEAGVITDIVSKLAGAQISGVEEICATSYSWLAQMLDERHEQISEALQALGRRAV